MMCEVFPPFLLDIVVCDAQKHKYCIYRLCVLIVVGDISAEFD